MKLNYWFHAYLTVAGFALIGVAIAEFNVLAGANDLRAFWAAGAAAASVWWTYRMACHTWRIEKDMRAEATRKFLESMSQTLPWPGQPPAARGRTMPTYVTRYTPMQGKTNRQRQQRPKIGPNDDIPAL